MCIIAVLLPKLGKMPWDTFLQGLWMPWDTFLQGLWLPNIDISKIEGLVTI